MALTIHEMETTINKCLTILCISLCLIVALACAMAEDYDYAEYPLERAGIRLHLDCVTLAETKPDKHILLIHGVTYSSHEFDVDYRDYSLVRRLAREGYGVWRLDIAGFGQSGMVADGFLPDTDYAVEDIRVAVESIVAQTGFDKIDVPGWSWGGMTTGRFAGKYPEHLRRLVLYAPVLSGIGEYEISEDFHHNTWEHAADDFQHNADGSFSQSITDPVVIHVFCSNSWRYDGEYSPNGGRRDICVAQSEKLVDLEQITVPTLLICGDSDPYMNYELINTALDSLPENSELEIIKGGSHVAFIEEPYHCVFQNRVVSFLSAEEGADQSTIPYDTPADLSLN